MPRSLAKPRGTSAKLPGRWESTHETCWVLLALDKYFNTYEKVRGEAASDRSESKAPEERAAGRMQSHSEQRDRGRSRVAS